MTEARTTFQHATLAEIFEQPAALLETLSAYAEHGVLQPTVWEPFRRAMQGRERLVIAASGSSRHAGMLGEIMMEEFSGIAVDVEYASEYVYRKRDEALEPAVLVISQSGETADTLAALRDAKLRGERTIAITNVAGSSMEREAEVALRTRAGKERAIAATKSFVTQLSLLYLMAVELGRERGVLDAGRAAELVEGVQRVPGLIESWLPGWETEMRGVASSFADAEAFLFAGRGPHYPIAREAALKLKEMSYVHAEAYPTGELKHGPNALLGPGAPLIVLATRDERDPLSMMRYEKTVQLLADIEGQRTHTLAIASEGDARIPELCRSCVFVPAAAEFYLPFVEIVPLQLFAYFMSVQRGNNVDQPRNLVKAVVVE